MTYDEVVQYLYDQTPLFQQKGAGAYKEGLSNTLALDEHFGHPHRQYKTIHVAGTNGKGSVSHTLASILQEAGYRVGLYTSPHLVDMRERIRVNGEMIPKRRVIDFVKKERAFFEPLYPSFFEVLTALAFQYFAEQQVDVAVVEVGLGGRLDCTNIISPEFCVITNISFDHVALLAKKALLRPVDSCNPDPFYADLEREMLEKINRLGIGPQGFGGRTTAIGVNIETLPTHIAGMPCAVNISCHVTRHESEVI